MVCFFSSHPPLSTIAMYISPVLELAFLSPFPPIIAPLPASLPLPFPRSPSWSLAQKSSRYDESRSLIESVWSFLTAPLSIRWAAAVFISISSATSGTVRGTCSSVRP